MNQSINLNLIPDGVKPVAKVSQFDVGRVVTFALYQGPDVYTPPAGTTLEIRELKSDKHICVYDDAATLSGSTITLETTQQMTAAAGEALCQFKLTNGTEVLATLNFWLDVQTDPAAEGDISDSDIPGIIALATEQMERAEAAADSAAADAESAADSKEDAETAATSAGTSATNAEESAEDAEAYAIGTRGGTAVPSTDPAYQNNSKYYSDLASAWAAHPPYVGANGDWYVYDPTTQQFVDTGIDASITMQIQDVTMLAYGSAPTVNNSGTSTDAVFHLGIPMAATISTIDKTSSSGLVDTYTITMQNGDTFTFTVTNGANGGGHIIEDPSGQNMPARNALQFTGGVTVSDDQANNRSVVQLPIEMLGASTLTPGARGLVPAPAAGDENKFLRGDGTWAEAGGGGTTIVQKPTVAVGTYTYNGTAQGPTITWATGMEDNCVVTNATKTDAGSYTLTIALKNTAKMVWNDMTTADMTYEYSIAKANQTLTLSTNSVTLDPDHLTASVTVTGAETALSATSSDNTVATASISGSTVTVSNVNENNGSATITLTAEATNNYNSATATISVTAAFTTFLDGWLTAADLNPALYADLNAVFADEKAVRKLFTIHDAVDYLVTNASDSNVATIINNDYCAKWINLRDYALDTLYANATIAALMDTADKYFYGEWVITDSTTTPVTWGAKGNVPVMTSDTAPYGTASDLSHYSSQIPSNAFDGNSSTVWAGTAQTYSNWIQYKFVNPVCVKKFTARNDREATVCHIKNWTLKGSNDGETFNTISSNTNTNYPAMEAKFDNNNYYLYYRLEIENGNTWAGLTNLQFYGRTLKVSVPTMTSNTAPYGEVSASSEHASGKYNAWKSFDGVSNDYNNSWMPAVEEDGSWICYKSIDPIKVNFITFTIWSYHYFTDTVTFYLEGSNDGTNWTKISDNLTATSNIFTVSSHNYTKFAYKITNGNLYLYNRLHFVGIISKNSVFAVPSEIQFYGLDYSEYDWDEDHPRHYLYDHGVELETITISGTATKESDSIRLSAVNAQAIKTLDTTSYNLLRGEVGSNAGGTNALICGSGSASFTASYMPYNQSLDVSSINGSNATGVKQTAAGVFDSASIWLE